MIKEMISVMNEAMYKGDITFDTVTKLCAELSKLTGKKYSILNKRVVIDLGNGHYKDAWVNL
jgi:hypothetical protein